MGLAHSPSIISDGLIIYLDAANQRSYAGSGTFWYDLSGTGNTAYLINGPSFSGAGGSSVISCDGTNDYIEVIDNSSLDFGLNNFTVEYWAKKTASTVGSDNIWGPNKWNTGASPGTNEWTLSIGNGSVGDGSGDHIEFYIESGSTLYGIRNVNYTFLNTWKQFVGIRSGGSLVLYLNGASIGSTSPSGMTPSTSINNVSGRNLRINNSYLNNLYTKADNSILRIYNRALSATEILQNYNATRKRFGL
jgi:hypothetical protein